MILNIVDVEKKARKTFKKFKENDSKYFLAGAACGLIFNGFILKTVIVVGGVYYVVNKMSNKEQPKITTTETVVETVVEADADEYVQVILPWDKN